MSNCYGNCKAIVKRLMKDQLENLAALNPSCKCEECFSCNSRKELYQREKTLDKKDLAI